MIKINNKNEYVKIMERLDWKKRQWLSQKNIYYIEDKSVESGVGGILEVNYNKINCHIMATPKVRQRQLDSSYKGGIYQANFSINTSKENVDTIMTFIHQNQLSAPKYFFRSLGLTFISNKTWNWLEKNFDLKEVNFYTYRGKTLANLSRLGPSNYTPRDIPWTKAVVSEVREILDNYLNIELVTFYLGKRKILTEGNILKCKNIKENFDILLTLSYILFHIDIKNDDGNYDHSINYLIDHVLNENNLKFEGYKIGLKEKTIFNQSILVKHGELIRDSIRNREYVFLQESLLHCLKKAIVRAYIIHIYSLGNINKY